MKATLKFNLPEEQEEFKDAQKAPDYKGALWEVSQEIFRPARKHGYPDSEIQSLLDTCGEKGSELVSKLEALFYTILEDREITL